MNEMKTLLKQEYLKQFDIGYGARIGRYDNQGFSKVLKKKLSF
jgi:hypothetical protein